MTARRSRFDLCGVDSGFDQDVVAKVIRALGRGKQLTPTKGIGFHASSKPFNLFRPEPGATIGRDWRKAVAPKIQMLCLNMDVNRWKSFYRNRIRVPLGDPGSYSFCGDPKRPQEEQMCAEHHVAEIPTPTSGPWGEMEEWKLPPNRPDNHLWDCAVGACVLATPCLEARNCPSGNGASRPAPRVNDKPRATFRG